MSSSRREPAPTERNPRVQRAPRPESYPFAAELELAELDDRRRPGTLWTGRAVELSRSHLVFRSRRMCHTARSLVVVVHLVDDRPVALFGAVHECEYDADGLYKTLIELAPAPDEPALGAWIRSHDARGVLYPAPVDAAASPRPSLS